MNHSINFGNPTNGACANRVEGMWNIAKRNKEQEAMRHAPIDLCLTHTFASSCGDNIIVVKICLPGF